ncbi:MAG: polyhydroxyalkanoic acid system family protein [Pseudomonadota bacterium]|jgi:hypothetical protein
MTTPITVDIPHSLGRIEARRRIETGFASIVRQLPGGSGTHSERWEGDRLVFAVSGLGQTISGIVEVRDATVNMQIELPAVLGLVARGVGARLRQAGRLLLTRK